MNLLPRSVLTVSLAALTACLSCRAAEPLKTEHIAQIRALVKPDAEEDRWERIPWHTNLWEARKQAAERGKPILLWEMDGHPLGCV